MTKGLAFEMTADYVDNLTPEEGYRLYRLVSFIMSRIKEGSYRLYAPSLGKPSRLGIMFDLKGFKARKIAVEWTHDEVEVTIWLDAMGERLLLDFVSLPDELAAILHYCRENSIRCRTDRYDPHEDLEMWWGAKPPADNP